MEDDPQLCGVQSGEIDGVCCRQEAQVPFVGSCSDGDDSTHWQLLDLDLEPGVFSVVCDRFLYLDSIRTFEFNTATVLTRLVHLRETARRRYSQVEDIIAGLGVPFHGP